MARYYPKHSKIGFSSRRDDEEENTYFRPKKSWSYGGSWKSDWSNFSFLSAYSDDDDNSNLFVKDPITYITPTSTEISKKVRVWKKESIDTIKELSRVCYFKMIDEKDYISDKFLDYDALSEGQQVVYKQKKELFDKIKDQYIPGFSPLEQAVAIYLKLQNETVDQNGKAKESDRQDLDLQGSLDFDRALYTDPHLNEQLEFNELSKQKKIEILNKISLIGEMGSQFKVEKLVDEKIVANSEEYLRRPMRDFSQSHMIDLYQRLMPNYRIKYLTKDLTVNVPVDRKEQKQKIIILLDYSGSMDETEKQIWVNAILIDRFRYVLKGEAEVFFSYFVSSREQLRFHHIKDRDDVLAFWQTFSNYPTGGTTDIDRMVRHVASEIENKKLHNLHIDLSEEKPEILIINDGQIGLAA